ncbi:hypothetical protein MJO28_007476 [Puccinia striiformis f. sp. tritici]|uniref:Uncharacterized protein n=1 Tax=Puccinia striiformis f. sp. tritici TaxID=168172 RepID=A0ACC0EHH7_9BASI|nr:hypothetical protein Pst134EA_013587 [Puccinia striiformis f. sp. tritici]KAI9603975.1 hypothetical protein H4Q26_003584 [Puccinia striiformis f. sp. tritici PST-130]KAH9454497.1 hypothetical protein Pst134EB_014575 [Puccinia striiformis f. sp. tritici]KAH9465716.1 hypothetical protein Pst134EA_013587 [Puccinia striiformis f. sp. tritici]KAI7951792.1 hypothetical protein MJO28_007476 [Puccinia striiformis f. sp. tritici]KAI9612401.1 hypothetical protein KEM48_004132 [Puccinia striiformis f.
MIQRRTRLICLGIALEYLSYSLATSPWVSEAESPAIHAIYHPDHIDPDQLFEDLELPYEETRPVKQRRIAQEFDNNSLSLDQHGEFLMSI